MSDNADRLPADDQQTISALENEASGTPNFPPIEGRKTAAERRAEELQRKRLERADQGLQLWWLTDGDARLRSLIRPTANPYRPDVGRLDPFSPWFFDRTFCKQCKGLVLSIVFKHAAAWTVFDLCWECRQKCAA